MAITSTTSWAVDKSGNGFAKQYWSGPSRVSDADPAGTTPLYAGEIILDTAGKKAWVAMTLANNSWITYNPPVR